MNFDHNFSVGLPDNIVFVEEFLSLLDKKLSENICLYCEKTFKDRTVLKEHMRKKVHKKINPLNKEYDKFYLVNYLEPGKTWKEIMEEFDEYAQNEDWSDWFEPDIEAICLFCDFQSSEQDILSKHISSHNFDFLGLKRDFSIYQQIKIVNYVRRQVHEKKCIFCDQQSNSRDELTQHMQNLNHFQLPERSTWDQSQLNELKSKTYNSEIEFFLNSYLDIIFLRMKMMPFSVCWRMPNQTILLKQMRLVFELI